MAKEEVPAEIQKEIAAQVEERVDDNLKNFRARYSWTLAGAASLAAVSVLALSGFLSNWIAEQVNTALMKSIEGVERNLEDYGKSFSAALDSAETLQDRVRSMDKRVDSLKSSVDVLTTDELSKRLAEIDTRVVKLTGQLETFRTIVSPESAAKMLTVARMAEEIEEREKLEKTINSKVGDISTEVAELRIEIVGGLRKELVGLQYWIWGTLVAVVLALGGGFGALLRGQRR